MQRSLKLSFWVLALALMGCEGKLCQEPMDFNILFKQTVQVSGGSGIWFASQGVASQRPRLVIDYSCQNTNQTAEYQYGLNGMDNAYSIFIEGFEPFQVGEKHSILAKQRPLRNGLFRADIRDIPMEASIISATLHLHIHTEEGLGNSDNSSVWSVHAGDKLWDWDQVSWTHFAAGEPWSQAGGDFGEKIRDIRAKDMHDVGFSKASPHAYFDFTDYVRGLQATRVAVPEL